MESGKSLLEIDLNEAPSPPPLSSPRQDLIHGSGGGSSSIRCGSCGKGAADVAGEMLVCVKCGLGFHMKCMGAKTYQLDWKCFSCLFTGGGGGGAGTSSSAAVAGPERSHAGMLDMNAPPPDEDEVECLGGASDFAAFGLVQQRREQQNGGGMQAVSGSSFLGQLFCNPVTFSNLLYRDNGNNLHKDFHSVTHDAKSRLDVPLYHSMNNDRTSEEAGMRLKPDIKLIRASQCTQPNSYPHASELYLQSLREHVIERKGLLGTGWHVEFEFCPIRCKTNAIYCAPDGSRFESMSDVARGLGLVSNDNSVETEARGNGFTLSQNGLLLNHKRKEATKYLGVQNYRDSNNIQKSDLGIKFLREAEIPRADSGRLNKSIKNMELNSIEPDGGGSQRFYSGLPVQFEELFIISPGKVDRRASYHDSCHIWPVGYKSCWHDRISGSLFECNVSDGGDIGPIFKVRRSPCSTQCIPNSSTVLSRSKIGLLDIKGGVNKDDLTIPGIDDDDESTSIQMMLAECDPPNLDSNISSFPGHRVVEDSDIPNCTVTTSVLHPRLSGSLICCHEVREDNIGEFSVEGRSSSSVWEMVSQTLLHACHKAYKQAGVLQFFCDHDVYGRNLNATGSLDSLSKFSYSAGSVCIPDIIKSITDFDAACETIATWLQQDRFGLDLEFVQEVLEQLPDVNTCSEYIYLDRRNQNTVLQTVGSGFLLARGKDDVQVGHSWNGFISSYKGPRKLFREDSQKKGQRPLGKPFRSKLPASLIGDVLQVWEFSQRFSGVLGLEGPFSFQELEYELISPWLDDQNSPQEKAATGLQEIGDVTFRKSCRMKDISMSMCSTPSSAVPIENPCALEATMDDVAPSKQIPNSLANCTGVILPKAHIPLLKILIDERLSKLVATVNSNLDSGEIKSKRGRKKDLETLVVAKRTKLDIIRVNDLTWPELARRLILSMLYSEGNIDSAEFMSHESGNLFRCLQGDGGPLCGSLTGVAVMEADALLLAEASNQIFGSVKSKNDVYCIDQKECDVENASIMITENDNEVPDWAQVLEPVRKLPTNVGARIRKCVFEALERNPPEWAKKILEHSISKEVYKGNASGPTKRAVISVLEDTRCDIPQPKPEKKEKGRTVSITVSDLVMKTCRLVLRNAAAKDKKSHFYNLLGISLLNSNDNDDERPLVKPVIVSRPLDFRTIDLRLAAGGYGGSHEAFFEDVQEVWNNIRKAYGDRADMINSVAKSSQKFEDLYEKEVLTLVRKVMGFSNSTCLSDEAKKEIDDMLLHASECSLPKAPWEEGICKVCGMDKDDDNVLLCDKCDSEYHTYCLNPPLERIPEGNWYCPSCITGKKIYHGATVSNQALRNCKRKRHGRDFTNKYLDSLSQLANTLEIKEYWEFTIEERILLIKFLSDEVLSSTIIREHLDQCASLSADLQQKLRSLTSEWKILKSREEIVAANLPMEKMNGHGDGGLESDVLPSMVVSDGQVIEDLSSRSNCISSSAAAANIVQLEDVQRMNGSNNKNKQQNWSLDSLLDKACPSKSIPILKASQEIGQSLNQHPVGEQSPTCQGKCQHDTSIFTSTKNSNSFAEISWRTLNSLVSGHGRCNGNVLSPSRGIPSCMSSDTTGSHVTHVNVAEACDRDASILLRNEFSCLRSSIKNIEAELLKVSVRKEFLGRDSAGRLYWVFGKLGTSQGVFNGCLTAVQGNLKDLRESIINNLRGMNSYLFAVETPSSPAGLSFSNMNPAERTMDIPVSSSWSYYQSETEMDELVRWLTNNDAQERELREAILHWLQIKTREFGDAKDHFHDEIQKGFLDFSSSRKCSDSNFLATNAATSLEKRFGSFHIQAQNILEELGCRTEESGRMYRCECLEPLWPSKHHCVSCHKTFSTCQELDEHSNGTCNMSLATPQHIQINGDSSKYKRIRTETSFENNSDLRILKVSQHENPKRWPCFSDKNDPECPFNFEEIRTKFLTQNSLKDVVKEIGLIGSCGTPSFVQKISPHLVDPSLSLVPSMKNEVGSSNASKDFKNQQPKRKACFADALSTGHIADRLLRRSEIGINEDPPKVDRSNVKGMGGKDQLSFTKKMLRGGKFAIIREASLKPLLGRASLILTRLKINLLDMDAALPEEALRPSRANSEKRCVWRAFVKSAESVYEMSQATIVLEDMIKTEYLRNDWYFWSSPSAAATISTLSALALRICTLDAAIIYENIVSSQDPLDCISSGESPPDSSLASLLRSSARLQKSLNSDPANCLKRKSRSSKRKKES